MKQVSDFGRLLTDFLTNYLIGEKGVSNNTVKSYSITFILLLRYMRDVKRIDIRRLAIGNINRNNIVDFLDWMQKERKCGISTRNQRLAAIAAFTKFLQYKYPASLLDCQEILTIPSKKHEEKIISYLNVEGIKLLLEQPDKSTILGLRDLCLLSLMYESAARVQEIIDLTPTSLRINSKPYCVVLHGKGNKNRVVPLSENVVTILNEYMKRSSIGKREFAIKPLFPNKQLQKMTRNGINNILVKYFKMVQLKNPVIAHEGISCHSIRHSKAMNLLEAGVELIHIRDFLGHKSVITTELYARVNPKFTFEAVKKAYADISEEIPIWEGNEELIEKLKELSK